jgi:hypothetical protein
MGEKKQLRAKYDSTAIYKKNGCQQQQGKKRPQQVEAG